MQTEIPSFSDFGARTDALAAHLGVTLDSLPTKLGISRDMLFGYRRGRYPITAKAALKLASAEREAGLSVSPTAVSQAAPVLDDLRLCIQKAQSAESLISDLKRSLEKLIKKL